MTDRPDDTREVPQLLPSFLIEIHRLDLQHWGNLRTAAVVRCVATDNLTDGRPAKVNKIANVLDFGVATVHSHLRTLARWHDPQTSKRTPLVRRVPGGYELTPAGWATLRAWSADAERVRRHLDSRHPASREREHAWPFPSDTATAPATPRPSTAE